MSLYRSLEEQVAQRPELRYYVELGRYRARLKVRTGRLLARRHLPTVAEIVDDLECINHQVDTMNLSEIQWALDRITPVYTRAMNEPDPLRPADAARRRRQP